MSLRSPFSLGRVRGIPVRVDASWAVITILVTWSVARSVFPAAYPDWTPALTWGMAVLASALFFLSVLAHEVAHSLVALARGLPVNSITLYVFGGISAIEDEPPHPGTEFAIAFAGPLTSLLLGATFYGVSVLSRGLLEPVEGLALLLGRINLSLGVFNLIPGFPLDGGRVLRAAIWAVGRNAQTATRWAARVGQLTAFLFIVLGIVRVFSGAWLDGLWLAFIGIFLDNAARAAFGQLTLRRLLDGHVVAEVMSPGCRIVPPQLTLDVFVEHYLVGEARRCFPVGTADDVLGLLTVHGIRRVPTSRWRDTRAGDVMTPLEELRTVDPSTPLWDALRNMTEEGVNQLPVLSDGALVGMVSRENLVSFLHAKASTGL